MALPVLEYVPASQNTRVEGYETGSEEKPHVLPDESLASESDYQRVIWAAYRQIFSEHQILSSNRQKILESQLRYGQITVRDFIRGLATSEQFRRRNYEPNSNYRFAELCVQRLLGRDVYSEREKIAWSIVIAQQGLESFIDALLDSEEYVSNFGYSTVPYQRRRILPQHDTGETPFNLKTPRYGPYHRAQLGFPQIVWQPIVRRFTPQERQPREGDPRRFLGMARGISSAKAQSVPRVSALNIDYERAVPYRRAS